MKKLKKSLILLAFSTTSVCGLISIKNFKPIIKETAADMPSDYYSKCEGKEGSSLQSTLLSINSPKSKSYDWSRYEAADEALDDSSSVLCLYTRHNIPKGNHCGSYAWTNWNREHIWTQTAYPASKTDNHNIFACEGQINNYRGNMAFGEVAHTSSNQKDIFGHKTDCYWTNSYFEPCDEAKGEVARSVMYGTVMYSYNMTEEIQSIELALKWHVEHPITERDTKRNDVVYGLQGNRNPFVDHPEYACKIWGNTNDATKKICGSQPTPTKTLTDLTYTGTPTKKDYVVGESFNPSGLTVTAKFSDNTSQTVTNDVTWSTLVEGQTSVTGSYTYESTTKNVVVSGITVSKPAEKTLSSLSKTGTLAKKDYVVGESFNPTGLTITANFSDGSSELVTNQVVWPKLTVNQTSITGSYTYEGVTETIVVSGITVTEPVKPKTLVDLDFDGELVKKDYVVGESFDPTGLTITASYSDGSLEDVSELVKWSPLSKGDTSVTGSYTYLGVTETVSVSGITVTEPVKPKTLVDLDFDGELAKKDYVVGESFDPTGLTITASYSDDTSENVTQSVTWSSLNVGDTSVTGSYSYEGTTKTVTISGLTVKEIEGKQVGIVVIKNPNKVVYNIGDVFELDGIKVISIFDNGKSVEVTDEIKIGYPNLTTAGTKLVNVSYENFKTTFCVVVLEATVTKIDLTVHPHKEEYYKNEKFNSSGAVVKAHLSNGTIIDNVIDQCSFTYDFNKSEWVTVSFCDQSQQFKITILQGSPSIQHKAADFAYSFNELMSEIDVANVSMQKWESMKYYFNQLDAASKAFIKNLNTNDGEGVSAGVSNEEALTECVNKYDDTYLEHKDEGFEDFIGRNPKPRETSKEKDNDDLLILIAVIGGIVLLTIIIVSIAVPVSKKHKRARA